MSAVALLLAAAAAAGPPATAVEAERRFAADAQADGMWTAFRRWSTPEAVMFDPKPVRAHKLLRNRADPPVSLRWWPSESWVSCDGTTAINTGGWMGGAGGGYIVTVWVRQSDGGWKWVYDGGDVAETIPPMVAEPVLHRAACGAATAPAAAVVEGERGEGASPDRTLAWRWHVADDGSRLFTAWTWDGARHAVALENRAAPPEPAARP